MRLEPVAELEKSDMGFAVVLEFCVYYSRIGFNHNGESGFWLAG